MLVFFSSICNGLSSVLPQDHADSPELRHPAAFQLPDWSERLSEPQRSQRVQPVGEVRPVWLAVMQSQVTVAASNPEAHFLNSTLCMSQRVYFRVWTGYRRIKRRKKTSSLFNICFLFKFNHRFFCFDMKLVCNGFCQAAKLKPPNIIHQTLH